MTTDLRTRIIGTGCHIAEDVLTNLDFEKMVDTSDEWIVERTGIRERRFAPKGIQTSDMGADALKKALDMAGLNPNDLDMIVCGTVTPDRLMPAAATYIQTKVGATNRCPAFDLSAACAGFLFGLSIADSYIRSGQAKTIGVIGAETLSRAMNLQDRTTCVLFGDGAGAVVVTGDRSGRGLLSSHMYTDGSLADILKIPAGGSLRPASAETVADPAQHAIEMDGRAVFKCAVRYLVGASKKALEANEISADDIDLVVPHQANMRILDSVAQRIGIPIEKFVLNLDRMGNTSSASIPIALDEALREGKVKDDHLLLMIALGGGISWGSALIKW
jgi:3-oxoacyl-[acyl-carrier-protein] synthase-3